MARCEICGCPSGLHDSDCRADPAKNDLNVGYQADQDDGRVRVTNERDLFEGLLHEFLAAYDAASETEIDRTVTRVKSTLARVEADRKARR